MFHASQRRPLSQRYVRLTGSAIYVRGCPSLSTMKPDNDIGRLALREFEPPARKRQAR